MARKELSNKGLKPNRRDLFKERIFSELWEEKNKRDSSVNFGSTLLECILNTEPWKPYIISPKTSPVSQRDADVAATVIQWLGTNCGADFLNTALKRIAFEEKKLQEEFNRKFNKNS